MKGTTEDQVLLAERRFRDRWLHLLDEARTELDELTVAAHLGVLTAGWLAELPAVLADSWIERLAEQLENLRARVSWPRASGDPHVRGPRTRQACRWLSRYG